MRLFQTSIFLTALFLLSGCFEIVEELNHKANGSGNFTYTLNLSRSKEKLATILSLDSFGGLRIPKQADIQEQLQKGTELLDGKKGISNVQLKTDYDNFIFVISFEYSNIASFNAAARIIHENMSPYNQVYQPIFELDSSGIKRHPDAHSSYLLGHIQMKNPSILKDADYTTIFRFEREVDAVGNIAKLSKSKKAVMYKYKVGQLAQNSKLLEQEIHW
ncbi:MAG: hypothetical protein ACI8ZN_001754 [Bacteroidia bacterium]|jgi:hypothetical protein